MQMKFFLLLLLLGTMACNQELEADLSKPALDVTQDNLRASLAASDTRIDVFEQYNSNQSLNGLQSLTLFPPEGSKITYTGLELKTFFQNYTAVPADDRQVLQALSAPQHRQNSTLLDNYWGIDCQATIQTKTRQLQAIARQNCLSMLAVFNCSPGDRGLEIMVYLSSGDRCTQAKQKQIQAERQQRISPGR